MADTPDDKKLSFDEFPPVTLQEWENVIKDDLKGKNYQSELAWDSLDGFKVYPFYRKEDLDDLTHSAQPISHSASWHILETLDLEDIKHANSQALIALENGASGLYVDIPASAITSEKDFEILLKDVLVDIIPIHFSENTSSPEVFNQFKKYCSDAGFELNDLNVTFTFDPFSEALKSGNLPKKEHIIQKLHDVHRPFNNYAVDASILGEAGASIIEQIAYALAAGNEYLNFQEVTKADIFETARKIHFRFNVASSYFPEIAKFRAFRLLWSQILNAYENNLADDIQTIVHAKTAKWNKPRRDAHNNMIRVTTEVMSAAIGGCSHISVERFDKNWAQHSEFAARIARNTQLILQHESYLDKVADAGAGSYYIEKLTDEIALKSWELFQEIEKAGGLHEAMKSGMIQEQVHKSRDQKFDAYKKGEEIIVGLNKFAPGNFSEEIPDMKFTVSGSLFEGEFDSIESLFPLNIEQELD